MKVTDGIPIISDVEFAVERKQFHTRNPDRSSMQARLNLDLLTPFIDQIDGSQGVKHRWNTLQQTGLSGFGLGHYGARVIHGVKRSTHARHLRQLQTLLLRWT